MTRRVQHGQSPPAIVLGNGITALGVQRLFARAGILSYVADRMDPMVRRSRFYRPLPDGARLPVPDGLSDDLARLPLDEAVLVPCSDSWVRAVAELDGSLRQRFPSSAPGVEVADVLVDKARFADALRRLEIPHPRSFDLDSVDDLERVLAEGHQEMFFKPRDSQRFFREFGVKGFRFSSRGEAEARLRMLLDAGHAVIAQEYVPGPSSNHYFIDGFVDRQGRMRALFARRRLRMYPPSFGNSTYMKSVDLTEARDAADSVTRLLLGLGHRGMFSAEFKRDARDGSFRILEVNARPWWYVDFAARCGVDVCSMAYADALGREVPEVMEYVVGKRLVYPYMDYFACKELRAAGELGMVSGVSSWIGATQPVFQVRDPWPAMAAVTGILADRLKKRLGGNP